MEKTLKRTLLWFGAGLLLLLVVTVINQVYQISVTSSAIHPTFGRVVTIIVSLAFLVVFLVPIFGFVKLRKPLELPEETEGAAYEAYLSTLKTRMVKNKYLKEAGFVFDESKDLVSQLDEALLVLDKESLKILNETSSQVFITTAISQNGVLDGFFVLTSLSRIVWRISHIYNQRPTVNEIVYLYSNVAVTVMMAREIEDLILIDEQLEPLIDSLIGESLSTLVPGATAVASIIMNSVIEGSINAFLTLRVGAMAKRYSSAVTKADRRIVKRYATLEACSLFRTIVQQNSVTVVKAFAMASKRATIDRTFGKIKAGANKTSAIVKTLFKK